MITIYQNIMKIESGVIAHQVNCLGFMGCGMALTIRQRWPHVYQRYRYFGKATGNGTLTIGKIQMIRVGDRLWVANLAAQDDISRERRMTDYHALEQCLKKLASWAIKRKLTVFFPYRMGCGNAGGDWEVVSDLIDKYFPDKSGIVCKDRRCI